MPIYTFYDKKTKKTWDEMISCEDMEKYLKENSHIERIIKAPPIVDSVNIGITKPPADFQKHVLGKIKEKSKGQAIGNKRWTIPKEI
jgi:hypothetical protein